MEKLELFVDLDGVLVDFEVRALEIAGCRPNDDPSNKELRRKFWGKINAHINRGGTFFKDMPPMKDAFVLWDYVKVHMPRICSATGNTRGAGGEKHDWVKMHLGEGFADTAIFVAKAGDKALHAAPNHVLIDDRAKSIDPWRAAGGIGILHTSAEDTIRQLKELGL